MKTIIQELEELNKSIRNNLLDTVDIHIILKRIIKKYKICKDCPFINAFKNEKVIRNSKIQYKRRWIMLAYIMLGLAVILVIGVLYYGRIKSTEYPDIDDVE